MKLDLHNYITIGFQPYWLKIQGYNPEKLLEEIVGQCFSKEIDVCGITSKEFSIPKGSVHDRFGHVVEQAKDLSKDYKWDKIENSALIIERENKKVILLNTQGVITKNPYSPRRIDYLVIGDNQVENNLPLKESLKQAEDKRLISIVHYPFLTSEMYCGMSKGDLFDINTFFDAIAVHDAQIPFPLNLKNIINKMDIKAHYSPVYRLPMISVSGAHRIKDIGTAYIESDLQLDLSSKDKLLESLKNIIKDKNKTMNESSISLFAFLDWNFKFRNGLKQKNKI